MKKLALTIAVVLGMAICVSAQHFAGNEPQPQGGGLFGRGNTPQYEGTNTNTPMLPHHGESTNQDAPLGSGALLLVGFGAAYVMAKRNRK